MMNYVEVCHGAYHMTLDESKAQCYSIMSSRLHLMRDLIEDPAQLKTCGYKSLEHALTSIVRLTV